MPLCTKTTFRTGTTVPTPNEDASVAFGLVKTVERYLGSIRILNFADSPRERGVPI